MSRARPCPARRPPSAVTMSRVAAGLAVAATLLVASTAVLSAADHAYVGADKCKMCHKLEFGSWQETPHARATDVARASTARAFAPECLKCHATNADES